MEMLAVAVILKILPTMLRAYHCVTPKSDESTTSLDTQMTARCVDGNGKPATNGKSLMKSLPMAILTRK